MITNHSLMLKLQNFEQQINQTIHQTELQLEVGYRNTSIKGPYYYIQAQYYFDDGYTSTGLWVTIDEKTKEFDTYDKLSKNQIKIVQQFIQWLDNNQLLGQNVIFRPCIQLHPDEDNNYEPMAIHP